MIIDGNECSDETLHRTIGFGDGRAYEKIYSECIGCLEFIEKINASSTDVEQVKAYSNLNEINSGIDKLNNYVEKKGFNSDNNSELSEIKDIRFRMENVKKTLGVICSKE